jgi:Fe-S-cluster containining protein
VTIAEVPVTIGGKRLRLAITVPDSRTPPRQLLPIFRGLADTVVGIGVRAVERRGERVSCRAGCGACCRQPVPVSFSEAEALRRLVEAMPEPRRTQIKGRFAAAIERLGQAGLLERVRDTRPDIDVQSVGLEYFRLGIPCPFLEDESCSIHPDRPVACREYLVTSPAEECSRPEEERVRGVAMPAQVGRAMRAVERETYDSESGWVPLVLALEWAQNHPEPHPRRTGAELIKSFFARLQEEGGGAPGQA